MVWKQAEINELIKNTECQSIYCIDMKAVEKLGQAMQNLLDFAEMLFYELLTSFQ